MHLLEMLADLLQRKAERIEAFGRLAGHAADQAVAADRAELLGVLMEDGLDLAEIGRSLPRTQRVGARAKEIARDLGDAPDLRLQARLRLRRQLAADRAAEDDDVVAQPER